MEKINLKEKYIFFPLWFQPSATTYPFAGKNIDYLNCIKKLSKSIPAHSKIYIKENPDKFNLNRNIDRYSLYSVVSSLQNGYINLSCREGSKLDHECMGERKFYFEPNISYIIK